MSSTTPPPARRITGVFHRHPRLRLAALLSAPMAWLVVAYLGSLAVLLLSAFWATNDFTSAIEHTWNTDNFRQVFTQADYRSVFLRTLWTALGVTLIDILIALPMAFYMALVAKPRYRRFLVVLVLTPLWAGYLVKAYAWWVMFSSGGVLDWLFKPIGGSSPGFGQTAVVIVLAYLWLPYMVLPIYTGLEQLPPSVLAASADLGARPLRTLRSVVLPLLKPAIIAGSVFTFSLSLGDYLTVQIVGGNRTMLGNMIASNVTLNLPLAAALSCLPVLAIIGYLAAVRRTGALENL
jgi:putative spermidine/putrescine transport system permease protein